jgi:hypothetical protein
MRYGPNTATILGGKQVFGKKLSDYIRFDLWILILIAIVFAIRLGISLAGTPFATTKWVSINIVLLVGLLYCSVAVHTTGFGSYKQLFGLLLVQNLFAHLLIASGIILGIATGTANAFTASEVSGGQDGATWLHVLAHGIAGPLAALVAWLVGSAVLFVTKKVKPA